MNRNRKLCFVAFLLCACLLFSGCIQSNVSVTVNKDRSMDFSATYLVTDSMANMTTSQETTLHDVDKDSPNWKTLEKRGYKVEACKESGFTGFKATRHIHSIDTVSKETGVEIRIETHNEFSTGRSLKPILDAVPGVKIIWDVMHSIEMGETPEDTCSLIGDKITHVHIKDGRPYEDPDLISYYYTKLGEGTMPFERIFASLKNIGYKGYYSLEWENAWRKELLGMYENLRELLRDYNAFLDSFGI